MTTVDDILAQQQIMQDQYEQEITALKATLTQLNVSMVSLEQKQSQEYGTRLREQINTLTDQVVFGATEEDTTRLRTTHRDAVLAHLTAAVAQDQPVDVAKVHSKVFDTITSNLNGFSPLAGQTYAPFKQEAPVSDFEAAANSSLNGLNQMTMDEYLKQDKM